MKINIEMLNDDLDEYESMYLPWDSPEIVIYLLILVFSSLMIIRSFFIETDASSLVVLSIAVGATGLKSYPYFDNKKKRRYLEKKWEARGVDLRIAQMDRSTQINTHQKKPK